VFECVNTDYPSNHVNQSFIKHATKSRLQPLRGNIGQSAACLRHTVSDRRLKSIKERNVPTLVITGTIDNFVNPAHSHHLQKMLDARLEIFEGSGHALPEEQTERYNALLEEFFESSKTSKL
jgi:pimeloyl-ACP methyl ester carboxylesterase